MRNLKKGFYLFVALLLFFCTILGGILVVRAYVYFPKQTDKVAGAPVILPAFNKEFLYKALSEAVKLPTISDKTNPNANRQAFSALHQLLKSYFPEVFQAVEVKTFGQSLLLKWVGTDKSKLPVLFAAHLDVVPVDSTSLHKWHYPPFSGTITHDAIWGRGTLDDKHAVITLLQAMALLINAGVSPERTVYLAFGADEEVGGALGAKVMAEYLYSKDVRLLFVLDEGSEILQDILPGISRSVALIGVTEKGYMDLTLTTKGSGGHASMPPEKTSITELCESILNINKHPFPLIVIPTIQQSLEHIAPYASFGYRIMFSNLWLFKPILLSKFRNYSETKSSFQTTSVATILSAGVRANVLTGNASANFNIRILPGLTQEKAKSYIKQWVLADRYTLSSNANGENPAPVSSMKSVGYQLISKTIKKLTQSSPVIIAPGLVIAITDSRHYIRLTPDVYRFLFISATREDLASIHGVNEHISKENLINMVHFYYYMLLGVVNG